MLRSFKDKFIVLHPRLRSVYQRLCHVPKSLKEESPSLAGKSKDNDFEAIIFDKESHVTENEHNALFPHF